MFAYDAVLYPPWAYRETSPERIEVVARLFGLEPCPAQSARVLDVGCATASNLLPMAERWPDARFVGVDLGLRQIEVAREHAAAAGLTNVELHHLDITDLGADFGRFDYIIAHGFYAWVPQAVRDRLLEICATNLAPNGVAFISLDIKPGWFAKDAARRMMLHHVEGVEDPAARVREARAFLARVIDANRERDRVFAAMLADLLSATNADFFFYHDSLAPFSRAPWLHELVAHLTANGLEYFADADVQSMLPIGLPPEAMRAVEQLAADLVEREQYLDILRGRPFREALVCRAGLSPAHRIGRAQLEPLWVGTAGPGVTPPAGASPRLRAALARLAALWPASLPFVELAGDDAERFAGELIACFAQRSVELSAGPPRFAVAPRERPAAGAYARLVAAHGGPVASLSHANVHLDELERRVLPLLDGTRDRAALRKATGLSAAAVDKALTRLGRLAMLLA